MKKEQFIADLAEMMEVDDELTLDTDLSAMEEFDSLIVMGLVVYIDKNFSKKLTGAQFADIKTVADLVQLIGEDCFV